MEEENSKLMRWKQTAKVLLGAVNEEACQPYSISLVPYELRKWNEKAYIPKVISIGPRHKGRKEVLQTEDIKWRCVLDLLSRAGDSIDKQQQCYENCMEAVLNLDAAVRTSYSDEITLDRLRLASIMVFDGCFLLELLISATSLLELKVPRLMQHQIDNIGQEVKQIQIDHLLSDLMLLENQIPIVVLEKLFRVLFNFSAKDTAELLRSSTLSLFGFSGNDRYYPAGFHFLDICYRYVKTYSPEFGIEQHNERLQHVIDISQEEAVKVQHLNRCATRLKAVGIIIAPLTIDVNTAPLGIFEFFKVNITFSRSNLKLGIPVLNITKATEPLWRNFIAWEHHKNKLKSGASFSDNTSRCCIFTSAAFFFRDLMCSPNDVQLLRDKGILVDSLGLSNREMLAFFNSIVGGADRSFIDPMYSGIFHALNSYPATNYAAKISILCWHYFCRCLDARSSIQKFLRHGYNSAATVVLLLTVIQTCYAIISFHFPKR